MEKGLVSQNCLVTMRIGLRGHITNFLSKFRLDFSNYTQTYIFSINSFLVACTRLYKPLCWPVGLSVGRSVAEGSEHATYGDWPCF